MQAGGGVEDVEDTDAEAVTVMTLAEIVGVTVAVVVFVIVEMDVIVVRARVTVLIEVVVLVLVTTTTPGQFLGLTHPIGQTWLSAIRHWLGGGLMLQTGRWPCTSIGRIANSEAIMNLI